METEEWPWLRVQLFFFFSPTTWNNIHSESLGSYSEDTRRQHIISFLVNIVRNIYLLLLLGWKEHSLASQVQTSSLWFQIFHSKLIAALVSTHQANASLYIKPIWFKSISPRQKCRNSPWTIGVFRKSFLITTSIQDPNLG